MDTQTPKFTPVTTETLPGIKDIKESVPVTTILEANPNQIVPHITEGSPSLPEGVIGDIIKASLGN
jgi:hypothetical protein